MKNKKLKFTAECGIIAAIYFILTLLSSLFGLSGSAVQFRLSEALCFLPAFMQSSTAGLTLGCIISNISSPLGVIDIFFGSSGTLISCLIIRMTKKIRYGNFPVLSPLINGAVNGLVVGLEYVIIYHSGFNVFILTSLQVFISVTAVGYICGIPLFNSIKNSKILNISNEGECNEKNHSSR